MKGQREIVEKLNHIIATTEKKIDERRCDEKRDLISRCNSDDDGKGEVREKVYYVGVQGNKYTLKTRSENERLPQEIREDQMKGDELKEKAAWLVRREIG